MIMEIMMTMTREKEDEDDVVRRKNNSKVYNNNIDPPHFEIGMLFNDAK